MTTTEAKTILREAGEVYASPGDLRRIRARAFDPVIKKACDKLLNEGD
jgi:hypothetical protein